LKKQTQFLKGQNKHKASYNKELWRISAIGHLVKTNPIQSQFKANLPALLRGCYGPSGPTVFAAEGLRLPQSLRSFAMT